MKQCTPNPFRDQTSSGTQETYFENYKQNDYLKNLVLALKAKFEKNSTAKASISDVTFKDSETFSYFYSDLIAKETALPLTLAIATISRGKEGVLLSTTTNNNQILDKPKIALSQKSSSLNMELSRKWIREHRKEYCGKWVVLYGDQLLASANSSKELVEIIDLKKGKGRFITVVY